MGATQVNLHKSAGVLVGGEGVCVGKCGIDRMRVTRPVWSKGLIGAMGSITQLAAERAHGNDEAY